MCKYKHEYWDHEPLRHRSFKCKEKAVKDGFCIFHHPNYCKKHPERVRKEFYKKVESAVKSNNKLLCIGYNLPEISLRKKFPISVYFSHSMFHGTADFYSAKFEGRAVFTGASFTEEADFEHARFTEEARFNEATFTDEVSFEFAIFTDDATFSFASFHKEANFEHAEFHKGAYFTLGKFAGLGNFLHAKFAEVANFLSLVRMEDCVQSGRDPFIVFQSVKAGKPEKVRFHDFDLSNTSFAYTDISRIDISEEVQWSANEKLLDERRADDGQIPYEVIATVCRRLRQNLESKLRYTEAGRFFVTEMEVKRKKVKIKNRVLRWLRENVFSALAWYKYFSNYGESYQRLILWIVCTPLLAAFLTTLATVPISGISQLNLPLEMETVIESFTKFLANFQEHLRNYILAFFQLKTDNIKELAVRIISLLFMGQLYVALRRQFERKYVHPKM